MSTYPFDQGMQPAVLLKSADCEEINLGHASDLIWTLLTFNAAQPYVPVLPVAWCPYPALCEHGYLHWVISGTFVQTAVATTMRVRPIKRTGIGGNQSLAAGNMNHSTGAAAIAAGFFFLEVKMAVIGNRKSSAQQMFTSNLKVMDGSGVMTSDTWDTCLGSIDPLADQGTMKGSEVGLYMSFAAGAPTIVVKSFTCTHVGARNGS